jgi:multidrug efflux pump subunit AcrA (membrane-fusion protein)
MTTQEKLLRKSSIILGLLIIIGGIILSVNLTKSGKEKKVTEKASFTKFVEVTEVKNTSINQPTKTTGTLKASKSIDVYAEVGGNLLTGKKPFKSGVSYKKGEILLSIDKREELLNLEYQKTDFFSLLLSILPDIESDYPDNLDAWAKYIKTFDTKKAIKKLPEPKSEKEKFFLASKNIEYKYLGIKKTEFTLSKYTIYAPFAGILNTVNINPGALVRTGQKLGTFINSTYFELEISIPVSSSGHLRLGSSVTIFNDNKSRKWKGKIARIGKSVDETTQTQSIYIAVSGKDLFQGMYLNASIQSEDIDDAFAVKRALINKDNTVYIVDNNKIDLMPITIRHYADNFAIVQGIPDGTKLLNARFSGIHKGMKVELISNKK